MLRLPIMISLALYFALNLPQGDFAIRDHDTVVFLGDSITAARTYRKVIEKYTCALPRGDVCFINVGLGGDRRRADWRGLSGMCFAEARLSPSLRDQRHRWGGKADDEHPEDLDSIRGIIEACRDRKVRVFICSAAITGGDHREEDYLQRMCDEGMAISRSLGGAHRRTAVHARDSPAPQKMEPGPQTRTKRCIRPHHSPERPGATGDGVCHSRGPRPNGGRLLGDDRREGCERGELGRFQIADVKHTRTA